MAIVPGLDESTDLAGPQTLLPDEPNAPALMPPAEMSNVPAAELGSFAPQQADSGTGSSPTARTTGSALRDKIISLGMRYIGTPYQWGGTAPGGFDCSGLLQYIFGREGVNLPRVSYQQANYGQRIAIGALRPGDLVAWDENSRNHGADHIALYIGNGQILEAPHTGTDVRVRTLGKNEGAWGVALSLPGDR